jgi:hypothetical protein
MPAKYVARSYDYDGYEIGVRECDTLKVAKDTARYLLTQAFADVIETNRRAARSTVENAQDEVIYETFAK